MSEKLKEICSICKGRGLHCSKCTRNPKIKKYTVIHSETWTWTLEVLAESEEQVQERIDNEEIYFSMDDNPDFKSEDEVTEQ